MKTLVRLLVWVDARTGGDESCGESFDGKLHPALWCERKINHRWFHAGLFRRTRDGRLTGVIWG